VLDRYLAALKARASEQAPWAGNARYSENSVEMKPGLGVWRTITALHSHDFRFADAAAGQVAFYGALEETGSASPFVVRLRVRQGRIVEAETVVARPQDAGVPFLTAKLTSRLEMNGILPAEQRTPRARMIALASGYFDTLQLNDGTLHTQFEDGCNRRENGMQTTNNPQPQYPTFALGCAEQFRLGLYRYDDELRARRYPLVDEERGLVLASGFIDHAGALAEYRLTDGRTVESTIFRRPHSFYFLEAFKIRNGRIQAIEAVFTTVPYRMPSPWTK
jgi:hypothetical protein